jgi:hypothetical protein
MAPDGQSGYHGGAVYTDGKGNFVTGSGSVAPGGSSFRGDVILNAPASALKKTEPENLDVNER